MRSAELTPTRNATLPTAEASNCLSRSGYCSSSFDRLGHFPGAGATRLPSGFTQTALRPIFQPAFYRRHRLFLMPRGKTAFEAADPSKYCVLCKITKIAAQHGKEGHPWIRRLAYYFLTVWLQCTFPNANFLNAEGWVNWPCLVKSDAEIYVVLYIERRDCSALKESAE